MNAILGPIASGIAVSLLAFTAHATTNTKPSLQEKMKACSAEAQSKALQGTERWSFIAACIKAK